MTPDALRDREQSELILAWRRSDLSPIRRSTMKAASVSKATSPSGRRYARQPQAFCCGFANGRPCGHG